MCKLKRVVGFSFPYSVFFPLQSLHLLKNCKCQLNYATVSERINARENSPSKEIQVGNSTNSREGYTLCDHQLDKEICLRRGDLNTLPGDKGNEEGSEKSACCCTSIWIDNTRIFFQPLSNC